ncbi:unnamed protein product, partial [Enterobius vermicularis]|uniref:G_PROTEIN_RECEP_F1_2 domain-containing protein n=1 Tax=Enterobius vermicularis TaxID=51028 RepID=A0A0N4UUB4_ENTVE
MERQYPETIMTSLLVVRNGFTATIFFILTLMVFSGFLLKDNILFLCALVEMVSLLDIHLVFQSLSIIFLRHRHPHQPQQQQQQRRRRIRHQAL